jgi:predicted dehydrogenase
LWWVGRMLAGDAVTHTSVSEGERAQPNRILMVGSTYLYHPAVRELRRIISAGQLGKLYYIDAQRLNLGFFQRDVNVVWDLAPHDLSILRYLLGADPVAVSRRQAPAAQTCRR